MPQAEEICEHVVMIHRGRKVLDEQLATIRRRYDPRTIRFEPLDLSADLAPLRELAEVERVDRVPGGYDIVLAVGSDPGAAIRRITASVTPARIEISRPRLEDIFISIVSDGGAADAEGSLRANLQGLGSAEATA
jgi:ABC-type uncharacterized transport system ATPase subunit